MKYTQKSFSVTAPGSKSYAENWERTFRGPEPTRPPLLPTGDQGRACTACSQRFPREWCGHSAHDPYGGPDFWWCSPGCHASTTGSPTCQELVIPI